MSGRPWTPAEKQSLRWLYGRLTVRELARHLHRTLTAVRQEAVKLGVSGRSHRFGAAEQQKLRELAAQGLCNRCIGRELGFSRKEVRRWRGQLGLPPVPSSGPLASCGRCVASVRRRTAEQLRRAGLDNLGQLRSQVFRDRARAAGWPEDLRPRHVQILDLLAERGAMTKRELCVAMGLSWTVSRRALKSNDPEGSYTAHLLARSLVVMLWEYPGGKGNRLGWYMLAPGVEKGMAHGQRDG